MLRWITPQRRPYVIIAGIILIAILWWLFRPELLFVKKSVDEPLPGTTSSTAVRIAPVAWTGISPGPEKYFGTVCNAAERRETTAV